ncbi:MAG: SPOR domain-containing protein [Candidatus Omnitrophica bacterium]|nr:SPOR domain-containing protein [Candidatus Omnitrophota bacterium]
MTRLLRALCALAMTGTSFLLPVFAAEDLDSLQAAFLRGEYAEVEQKSRELLQRSGSKDEEDLLYLQGVSALKLDDAELARASLERLIRRHPDGRWAARARELLESDDLLFSVQVGAFRTRENALRLKAELERRGYPAAVNRAEMGGDEFHRVRVGRFSKREEAEEERKRLDAQGFPGKVVP